MDFNDVQVWVESLDPVDKEHAEDVANQLRILANKIQSQLATIGLAHEIEVYFGDDWLLLEDDHWLGLERGDWMNSSYTC